MFSDKETFKAAFIDKLQTMHGKGLRDSSSRDKYLTLARMVRDYIARYWVRTNEHYLEKGEKQVYYFSMEFLMGKLLENYLINLGILEVCEEGLRELDIELADLEEKEQDAGLGNGGLGRLAACFLDSMASLNIPGHGCGIRYKYGLFEQKVVNGYQVELPDKWLKDGYAWEVRKPDKAVEVHFGGTVRTEEHEGEVRYIHENYEPVLAVPYDVPIIGYRKKTVNNLRLWSAEAIQGDFDLSAFNRGNYLKAVEYKYSVEAISEILYPDDSYNEGRVLRLKQQYFFVSAGVQSIVRRYKIKHGTINDLDDMVSIHINDTHPALAVPELMRILMDEENLSWDEAWKITKNTISYTNHTVLPEALEKWPVDIVKNLLPRIYLIIEEINERFCRELWDQYPGQWDHIGAMAVIADGYVHMAHLAIVGSYSVNGVAKIHTEILKKQVMRRFYDYYPYKFNNKTNGITHRRWLIQANPLLTELITENIGPRWINYPSDLASLVNIAEDAAFQEKFYQVKLENKKKLASYIQNKYQVTVDPHSIFDVQVKRIHSYKRQILNILHVMHLYNQLKENPDLDIVPRTVIFSGKAAPGYYQAKTVIKLINTVGDIVNKDPDIKDKLKVVYLENYGVSLAQKIFPAADVSQQISTASKEASGTGNMKFMINGAVTMGTMDGANVEIFEEVGPSNIIIFGLTADEVISYHRNGGYSAWDVCNNDMRIKNVMEQLVNGFLISGEDEFRSLYNSLLHHNDEYFVLKDFDSYSNAHKKLDQIYNDQKLWRKMCIHNVARAGFFSSDRTIVEYAYGIWKVRPVVIYE